MEETKTMGAGKRTGYFFLALAPAAASLLLQLGVGMMVMIGGAVVRLVQYRMLNPGASQAAAMQVYMDAVYEFAGAGVFAYHVLALPVFGLWYYFGCGRPRIADTARKLRALDLVIALLGGVCMCLFSNAVVGMEQYLLPRAMETYMEMMETADIGNGLLVTFAAVVLAPVGEEILCRGLALYYARKALPRYWMANILQALLFAAIHGNLIQGTYAFAIGLMLGWLAKRCGSLLPCMLLHFTVNFSSTVWVDKVFFWFPDTLPAWLLLGVVTLAAALGLVAWGRGADKKRENITKTL